jgi:hypothetical protein
VAVETKIVPAVVATDINVPVAMVKATLTRSELAAGLDATLGFRADLNRALDGMCIKMADCTVCWTFHKGAARRRQGRPGRGKSRARTEAAARGATTSTATAARATATSTAARSGEQEKSKKRYRQPDSKAEGDLPFGKLSVHFHFTFVSGTWFSARISFTSIFEALAGGSNLNTKSGN